MFCHCFKDSVFKKTLFFIVLQGGAPTNGGDFSAFGVYFATSGDGIAAVEIAGAWSNVIIDGSRDEETR